jgi:recombination protein RecA
MAKEKENLKEDILQSTIDAIRKQFGEGSIMKLGEKINQQIEVVPTGSISLDIALGVGGIPRGRIIEIYGQESSGKTTLALHMIAEVQKLGGVAAFIDAEHALDPSYAKKIGVQIENLLISQPDTGEQALEICDALVKSGEVDMIVIDSVAALVPKAEIDGDMGDSHIGLQARLMSQALRKLTASISKTNSIVIFINQIRMKINTVPFGNPETTPGGVALKFYSSVRINVKKVDSVKDGEDYTGNNIKVTIKKNKVAPPFKTANLTLTFDRGIDKTAEIIELGEKINLIKKVGSWYNYNDIKLGQGKANAIKFLEENQKYFKEIEDAIREYYGLKKVVNTENQQKVDDNSKEKNKSSK